MLDLIVLSPCFYENSAPADLMIQSAIAHRLNVQLYGVGDPFIPHGADAQVAKLYDLMCKGGKLAEHVLMTDCRDVLFLADQIEIMGKFKAFKKELVMSAETGCWPPEPEVVDFFFGKDENGYNFANAGQFIGTWEYVRSCLQLLLHDYRGKHPGADNSQGWWMWAKMRGQVDFALDSQCQIFQTMSGGSDAQILAIGDRVLNTKTNTHPCSVHYNGDQNGKAYREMYRRLFLNEKNRS